MSGRESNEASPMTELRIVGISGNLTRPSKTRALVGEILRQAETFGAGRTELYDLVDAGPELGAAVQRESAAKAPDRVLSAIEGDDALGGRFPRSDRMLGVGDEE